MDANWIVAANSGRARFFALDQPNGRMQEINDMVNTAARQDDAEIETDTPGQLAASASRHGVGVGPTTSSTYQPHQTPKQHEAELFARDVAHYLQKAHNEGRFEHLCLVASPEFLGLLRRKVGARLGECVKQEINQDYTGDSPARLGERLRERSRPH